MFSLAQHKTFNKFSEFNAGSNFTIVSLFNVHEKQKLINFVLSKCNKFTSTVKIAEFILSPCSESEQWRKKWLILIIFVVLIKIFFRSLSAPAKLNGHAQLDVPGLSQNEIGLLLGSHHQSQQAINVKREPEDLRIDPKCPRSQKVSRRKKRKKFCFCTREE